MKNIQRIKNLYNEYSLTGSESIYDEMKKQLLGNVSTNTIFDLATRTYSLSETDLVNDQFIKDLENLSKSRTGENLYRIDKEQDILKENFRIVDAALDEHESCFEAAKLESGSIIKVEKKFIHVPEVTHYQVDDGGSFKLNNKKTIYDLLQDNEIKQISYDELYPIETQEKHELSNIEMSRVKELNLKLNDLCKSYPGSTYTETSKLENNINMLKDEYTSLLMSSFTKEEIVHTMLNHNESYLDPKLLDDVVQSKESHLSTEKIKTMYYGSADKIDSFAGYMQEGFTTNAEAALENANSGYVYECDLLLKKGISDSKITLPKSVYESLLVYKHQQQGEKTYVQRTNDSIKRTIDMYYEYNESDTELISNLCDDDFQIESVLNILNERFGYNHSIGETLSGEETIVPFAQYDIKISKIYDIKEMENKLSELSSQNLNKIGERISTTLLPYYPLSIDSNYNVIADKEMLITWQINNDIDLYDGFDRELEEHELEF